MANEKRLIDANALWDEVDKSKHDNPHTIIRVKLNHRQEHDHFLNMIFSAPTVDAVEVVRCKDCIHFDGQHYIGGGETGKVYCYGYCYHWDYEEGMSPNQVDADDFCSYGERKDNDL